MVVAGMGRGGETAVFFFQQKIPRGFYKYIMNTKKAYLLLWAGFNPPSILFLYVLSLGRAVLWWGGCIWRKGRESVSLRICAW